MQIALVGNQNSGKSTLFNTLTGANQKIGNWPGVTIEKKSGIIKNTNINVIDLPGIYSLNPYTMDEQITRDYIYNERIDGIINVIDCNSISRGLYLTMQLLELNIKVIVVLNMYDLAEKKGVKIDDKQLSNLLGGIPVIKISAISGSGCNILLSRINEINKFEKKKRKEIDKNVKEQFEKIRISNIRKNDKKSYDMKLSNTRDINKKTNDSEIDYCISIENTYKQIDEILGKVITYQNDKKKKATITDRLDKVFLNKYLAIPIFVVIMLVVYYISIEVIGDITMTKINSLIEMISERIESFLYYKETSEILVSLLIDGVFNGITIVVGFLPQLVVLFVFLSFLEKIGYMTRISFIFDKIFKKIGLSGNSIISFILGTGCSVPGIIATKTIKNEKEKEITAILTSFIPCSAKLPIISLFSAYFFPNNAGLVALSFYILSIVIIVVSALVFKKFNKRIEQNIYISELPEYRLPKIKYILMDTFERIKDFIKRTGSIILLSSIAVWFLLSFSIKFEYGTGIENSILANIGKKFSFIFIPMVGNNSWEIGVSAIQGLVAKEQVISSMAIIARLENENISNSMFVSGSPFEFFTPISAYSFVCFNLFCAPCFSAIGAMRKILGSTKKMLKAVIFQYVVAYVISCLVYTIGNKFYG